MKIHLSECKDVLFKQLNQGDVFLYRHNNTEKYTCIKIDPIHSETLGEVNAVDLADGSCFWLPEAEVVTPIYNAVLTTDMG